jgi:hypothetical protein
MRRIFLIGTGATLATVAILGGCGGDDGATESGAVTELTIVGGPEIAPDSFEASITCIGDAAESTGSIPPEAARAACDAALGAAGRTMLLTEPPADQVCTEIYGSDHTAHVTGTLDGQDVDKRFSRTNGCFIDEWTTLAALLPPTG